ncbi:MAG: PD40 domain-containing protein [Bacteroidetes bacterium]|nr:PD40 domain-containing protein [Bacteroidota bacterium]
MKVTFFNKTLRLILVMLTITSCKMTAQPGMSYSTSNKKAIKLYEESRTCYGQVSPKTGRRNLSCAEENAKKALEKDPSFTEAYAMLSQISIEKGEFKVAIMYKQKMMQLSQRFSPSEYFYLASLQMAIGDYEGAKKNASRYSQNRNANPDFLEKCRKYITNANFAIHAMQNPVDFKPVNLGPNINTERPEYFPSLTADDQTLLFTRDVIDANAVGAGHQEDIWFSQKNGDQWDLSNPISTNVNSIYNEGAPTFSADGKYVIFVGCEFGERGDFEYGEGRTGKGSCDLFASEKEGSNWSKPFNMGAPINTGNWESQPSFSSDGKTLYFIRGKVRFKQRRNPGEQDIYMTQIQDDGSWSLPKKLSDKINTPGREESVQIHPDGQTLYFSSDGHPGMGSLDIYLSRLDETGQWGKPENMGYPINTFKEENSTLVSSSGEFAYFASNRDGGEGSLDLYSFVIPESKRPIKTTFMKGKVYDVETKEPLAADFQLIDLKTGVMSKRSVANRGNGEFIVALPINKDFALIAEHDGYFFYSENYSIDKLAKNEDGFLVDVPMRPIKKGAPFVLENIFFDSDLSTLKPESITELNKLLDILNKNEDLSIELGGHTDSDGNDAHNLELSQNRAKAVVDWLIERGVDKTKLKYKGYGESKPRVENDTPQNKALNRRTEVIIL